MCQKHPSKRARKDFNKKTKSKTRQKALLKPLRVYSYQDHTRQQETTSLNTKFRTSSLNRGTQSKKSAPVGPKQNRPQYSKFVPPTFDKTNPSKRRNYLKKNDKSITNRNNNQKPTAPSQSNSSKYTRQGLSQET